MRGDKSAWIGGILWMAVLAGPWACGGAPARGQSDAVDLMVNSSPAEGGTVTPGSGIHRFAVASEVQITATPQEGYKFAYWLGDVADPRSCTTSIRMAGSRSVIAVFERDRTAGLTEQNEDWVVTGHGGGGGLVATATDFWAGGSIQVSGSRTKAAKQTLVWERPPASVPEPGTLTLLGLGTALLARGWRRPGSRS